MKKLITLCFLTFTLLFSAQGLNAQNTIEINGTASEKTKVIKKTIKLTKDQIEDVYQAYKAYETTYQKISSDLENNKEQLDKINTVLDIRFKEIFSGEQFDRYLKLYRTDQ